MNRRYIAILALLASTVMAGPVNMAGPGSRLYVQQDEGGGDGGGFTPASGYGATVVSSIGDGNVIVITRSSGSFGTHSDYNPNGYTWKGNRYICAAFKDFDNGVMASQGFYAQKSGGSWSPAGNELYLSDGGPTNSVKYLSRHYQTTSGEIGGLSLDAPATSTMFYTSFKFMQVSGGQAGKFFRVYGVSPQNNIYAATGSNPGNPDYTLRMFSECTAGSCSGAATSYGSNIGTNTWRLIEFEFNSVSNSSKAWINTSLSNNVSNYLNTSGNVVVSGHTIDYPNMIDDASRGGGTSGEFNFTDIFIDLDVKRFVLEDGSGGREPFIPLYGNGGWTTTSVALAMNQGAYASFSGKTLKFWNGSSYETIGTFD